MSKPLSLDLRERVVAAVADGLSRRKAAERFGVSAASSVRWCALERDQGDPKPKPMGGDQRSQRIEAHADFIMTAVAEKSDITLEELRERLAGEGVRVAVSTLWRFFARRGYTWKKRQLTRASRSGPT
jgi:transposase